MAKGGASEAATEPPPKQTRTPTRRKLDMLAANDAGVREDDAADEAVDISAGVRLPTSLLADPSSADPPDAKTKTKTSSSPPSARASRERVWSLLLGNVVRAVDEVYFLCEMECGAPEIEGTASLLEQCAADFKALLARVGDQERFLETHDKTKNASISWDVGRVAARPSDASRDMIRAVVDAEKDTEKDAWRPAGGKRGERRREKEKEKEKAEREGPFPRGARRRERRGKGAERMVDSDENTFFSAEKEKAETSRAGFETAQKSVRLPTTAKTKTKTLAPGAKPGAHLVCKKPPRPVASTSREGTAAAEPEKKQKSGVGVESTAGSDAEPIPIPPRASSLAASGASASSFGSWADSDDDDASSPPPLDDAFFGVRSSSPSAPPGVSEVSDSRTVWNAKRDWGAILAPRRRDERRDGDARAAKKTNVFEKTCLLYTSPSPRDRQKSRMPSSA